jgi:hypothetical protein
LLDDTSRQADHRLARCLRFAHVAFKNETCMPASKSACEENLPRTRRTKLKESVAQPATEKTIR